LLEQFTAARSNAQLDAFGCKSFCNGAAYALASTGNQRGLSFEFEFHVQYLLIGFIGKE
jgi:hypothetical protein